MSGTKHNSDTSSAKPKSSAIGQQFLADLDAVIKRLIDGTQVDAETSRRLEERADWTGRLKMQKR